ncbi:hypothetical protein ACQPW3_36085 [Actinosynnema sp. CA-248983]
MERAVQVSILALVGSAAGVVSFSHVHDWSMIHLPAGTPSAFGWVNAGVSELVPIGALITIRQRRRAGRSIAYPLAILLGASLLSLAAQLAVATPSPSGWLLASVPTLAFMALTKLVLAELPAASKGSGGQPVEHDLSEVPVPSDADRVPVAQAPRKRAPELPAAGTGSELPAVDVVPIEQSQVRRRKRVPSEVLRIKALELLASTDTPTRATVAAKLGVSDRRLRQVLNAGNGTGNEGIKPAGAATAK